MEALQFLDFVEESSSFKILDETTKREENRYIVIDCQVSMILSKNTTTLV